MPTQETKACAFEALHRGEPFVIPNPWDAGSARVLAALGFPALATTSSGFAFTLGRFDGAATLEEVVAHVAAIDSATDLPVSVDLENGYGPEPQDAARAIVSSRSGLPLMWFSARAVSVNGQPIPRAASTAAATRSTAWGRS